MTTGIRGNIEFRHHFCRVTGTRPVKPAAFTITFWLGVLLCITLFCAQDAFAASARSGTLAPDFTVDETFRSHLPLLVIEQNGNGTARLNVYDAPAGMNSLHDAPAVSLDLLLAEQPGGNVSAKAAYYLNLPPSAIGAASQGISLAGLPQSAGWRLHGSAQDKGMLRNGLAYALGHVLFPDSTPHTRYCEVLLEKNGRYYYQGIYILAEDTTPLLPPQGKADDAHVLLEYSPGLDKKRGMAEQTADSDIFLARTLRDRGFTFVNPMDGTAAREFRMESALDKVEGALRSLEPDTFLSYMSLLDQDSAINLYILNELLLNSDTRPVSFRLAAQQGEKLQFLPVWRFDEALDNTPVRSRPPAFEEPLPVIPTPSVLARKVPVWRQLENGAGIRDLRMYPLYSALNGDNFPWFDRLFLSRPFLSALYARYHELRRGPLSPENVGAAVDALAADLGPALERDWTRWADAYTAHQGPYALAPYTDAKGESHIRQTASYDQELVKIRQILRRQDVFLVQGIARLNRTGADLFDRATSGNRQAGYALASVIAFLFLTHWLTRKV